MHSLNMLQARIRACTLCQDAGYIETARPLTDGQAPAPFMVIGQAPSRTDHESGAFYNGPAGRKLKSWLKEAGFTDEDFGGSIYLAAITKCFPGRAPGSSKDRLPSPRERALCRPWLDAELELVQPRVMVLFGGLAIKTFLSPAPLQELIGQTFEQEGRLLIPLPHSSGASTWLNSSTNQDLLRQAILRLREARLQYLPETAESRV